MKYYVEMFYKKEDGILFSGRWIRKGSYRSEKIGRQAITDLSRNDAWKNWRFRLLRGSEVI